MGIAALLLVSCSTRGNLEEQTFIGIEQDQLIEQLGTPDTVSELRKSSEHIWGPVENFWYEMEMGETLTTWIYTDSNGRKELYFVEGSDEVAGEFYWYNDQSKNPVF